MAIRDFLRSVAKNPIQTGAIVPSSPALVNEMLRSVPEGFENAVVEIGPGTGAITGEILKRMQNQKLYTAFDLNAEFINLLKGKFPGVDFRHQSGDQIVNLQKKKMPARIVCSLPWTFLPEPVQRGMLNAFVEAMGPGSKLSTFIYANALYLHPAGIKFRKILRNHFPRVRESNIIWRNIPPAKVFHCQK